MVCCIKDHLKINWANFIFTGVSLVDFLFSHPAFFRFFSNARRAHIQATVHYTTNHDHPAWINVTHDENKYAAFILVIKR